MKNTNTNEFKTDLKKYLVPIIEDRASDYEEKTNGKPFAWAVETAKKELPHVYARKGSQDCLTEWLQGCALNIAIYNCDIVETSEKLHACKLTKKQCETIIAGWFQFIAVKILQFSLHE